MDRVNWPKELGLNLAVRLDDTTIATIIGKVNQLGELRALPLDIFKG